MDNKTLSIVSYITLIGWLISYFSGKENADGLLKYHLKQAFGLIIASITLNIGIGIVVAIIPSLFFLSYTGVLLLGLAILGIINAANEVQKPLPVIGKWAEKSFGFIK